MRKPTLIVLALILSLSACQKQKTSDQEFEETIEKMLRDGMESDEKEPDFPSDPALCEAISLHKPGSTKVDSLLAAGHKADCNCRIGYSRKKTAAKIPVVKGFARNKYERTTTTQSSALVAVRNGDKELIRKLVEAGADLNRRVDDQGSAAEFPLPFGDNVMLDYLLELGADPKQMRLRACNDVRLIEEMVGKGADGSTVDINLAVETGDRELLEKFLAYEPEIGELSYFGIIHVCDLEVLEDLLEYGMSPDVPDNSGLSTSLLIETMKEKRKRHVELLLEKGADLNFRDWQGYTPLHIAVGDKDEKMVRRLLDMGADPSISNDHHENLMEQAIRLGNGKIVRMLNEKGSKVQEGANLDFAEEIKANDEVIRALKK